MSNTPIPLAAPDIARFARSISQQLKRHDAPPSHLSLMNILGRAAGFRNYQHMRAAHAARLRLEAETPPEIADFRLVERALQQFDQAGVLLRWPSRRAAQDLCLWVLWSGLPAGIGQPEPAVNTLLNQWHLFGDAALLRRSLISTGLATRNRDGSDYRRVEKRPPPEALELIRRITARRATTTTRQNEGTQDNAQRVMPMWLGTGAGGG